MGACCTPNYDYESGDVKVSDYTSSNQPNWCGGCGDYAIWSAIKRALVELNISNHEVLLCFDIGCNGNMSDKIKGYRIHSLHGRVLPLAAGAKLANPNVKVIAFAGDGATYSEGLNHFVNSVKSNYPITFLVHDNGNYGLTTGQASATTPEHAPRTASPDGPTSSRLNPIELALTCSPGFVARGFSGNIRQLVEIFKEAIMYQDKGFAYVDILQSCPTYNKETTHDWYLQRVFDIKDNKNYDLHDLKQAKEIGTDMENKIATGVLYKNEAIPSYLNRLEYRKDYKTTLVEEVTKHSTLELQKLYV
ncbi:MAG: thiamine pyrophosphate-dependent enzyme [Candidatus Dojkabacteria bacterium]